MDETVTGEVVVADQALPSVPDDFTVTDANFWREAMLKQVSKNLAWNFLVAGKMLSELIESGYFGQIKESMGSFLASRGIGFGESVASKLVKIYRVFVQAHAVDPEKIAAIGDYEKAYKAANLVTHGMEPDEAIEQAKTLSRSDMTTAVREQRGDDDVNEKLMRARMRKWLSTLSSEEQLFLAQILAEIRTRRDVVKNVLPEAKYVADTCTFGEVMALEARLQEVMNLGESALD